MKILPGPPKCSVPLTINHYTSMMVYPACLVLLSIFIVQPLNVTANSKIEQKTSSNSRKLLNRLQRRSDLKLAVQSPSIFKKHANTADLIILPTMKTIPTKEGVHCDKSGQCFELVAGDTGESVEYWVFVKLLCTARTDFHYFVD